MSNLRGGFEWERISITLYVENVFDEEYYTGTQENFGLSGIRLRPHPRTYGATLVGSSSDRSDVPSYRPPCTQAQGGRFMPRRSPVPERAVLEAVDGQVGALVRDTSPPALRRYRRRGPGVSPACRRPSANW